MFFLLFLNTSLVGGFGHLGKDYPINEIENNPNVPNHQPDQHVQWQIKVVSWPKSTIFLDEKIRRTRTTMCCTGWGPKDSVQLPYEWLNSLVYGRYNQLVSN